MAYTTVVLVTGANQGIGYEIAKKLASENQDYHVILAGRREGPLNEAVATLRGLGSVEGLVMDVRSDESIAAAAQLVEQKWGRLDVLINNAGISHVNSPNARDQFNIIYDTNVVGASRVTDTFLPLLERSQVTKRIVIISSSLASVSKKADPNALEHNMNDYMAYSSSKSALNMVALHYISRFEGDSSWKINLTCPGFCATNLNGYSGTDTPQNGALDACRLAVLGPDGETGRWTNRFGTIPW